MGLLDKLSQGSTLTAYDGKTPPKYNGLSQIKKILSTSQLDLDGETPAKYLDNPPK